VVVIVLILLDIKMQSDNNEEISEFWKYLQWIPDPRSVIPFVAVGSACTGVYMGLRRGIKAGGGWRQGELTKGETTKIGIKAFVYGTVISGSIVFILSRAVFFSLGVHNIEEFSTEMKRRIPFLISPVQKTVQSVSPERKGVKEPPPDQEEDMVFSWKKEPDLPNKQNSEQK